MNEFSERSINFLSDACKRFLGWSPALDTLAFLGCPRLVEKLTFDINGDRDWWGANYNFPRRMFIAHSAAGDRITLTHDFLGRIPLIGLHLGNLKKLQYHQEMIQELISSYPWLARH